MKVLSGGDDIIWAVARIDARPDQVAAWTEKSILIWTGAGTELDQSLPAPNEGRDHCDLSISANGEWLVGYGADTLQSWRLVGKKWQLQSEEILPGLCLARFTAAPASLTIVFLTDAKRGSVTVRVVKRSFATRRAIGKDVDVATFPAGPCTIESAADFPDIPYRIADLSPDGQWLMLSARENFAHVWNARSGELVGSVRLRSSPNEGVFSTDGSLFAIDAGTSAYIHKTATLERVALWKTKHSYTPQLAWSPDDRWLARVDDTTTVRLFNIAAGQEASALSMKGHRGTAINFAPDGLTFLVGTFKGSVVVWDMDA